MKNKISIKKMLFLVAFAMVLLFMPKDVFATQIDDMTDLSGVLTGATINGTTITLTQNVDLGTDVISINGGTYIIDLNGYKITTRAQTVFTVGNVNITINDSSTNKTGIIESKNEGSNLSYAIWAGNGTNLTINGGTFLGDNGVVYNNNTLANTLTINGGVFGSNNSNNGLIIGGGTVVINGGTVNAKSLNSVDNSYTGLYVECGYGNLLDLTINNVNANGTLGMGINVDPGYPDNYNVKIKGGTYTGSIIGLFVSDVGIPNTKISGGHFKSTSTAVSDNVGGIAIWKSDATNGTSIYTLNSLLASGYNYTSKTFTDVPITFATDPVTYSTTASDVYVKKESTITIKNGITNGTITSTKATALTDEEVTLTVTPSAGYKLKSISVLDRYDEMPVTVINNKFTMPNYNVFVSAEFEKDVNYVVTEGANGSIINTSGDSLTFRINAEYSLLNKVYVDNEEISSDKMVTKSGSTIITLKNDYLKTLAVGKHTLKVSFTDGKDVTTNFEIKAESKIEKDETPKTGTVDYIGIATLIITISVLGISILKRKEA